ncbi:MAG: hypothetical protein ACYSU7_09220 [Planctomycetota bacterium]|jgi:hypothetical protein
MADLLIFIMGCIVTALTLLAVLSIGAMEARDPLRPEALVVRPDADRKPAANGQPNTLTDTVAVRRTTRERAS